MTKRRAFRRNKKHFHNISVNFALVKYGKLVDITFKLCQLYITALSAQCPPLTITSPSMRASYRSPALKSILSLCGACWFGKRIRLDNFGTTVSENTQERYSTSCYANSKSENQVVFKRFIMLSSALHGVNPNLKKRFKV